MLIPVTLRRKELEEGDVETLGPLLSRREPVDDLGKATARANVTSARFDAADAQRWEPDDQPEDKADAESRQERDQRLPVVLRHQDAGRVGTDAEERRMAIESMPV